MRKHILYVCTYKDIVKLGRIQWYDDDDEYKIHTHSPHRHVTIIILYYILYRITVGTLEYYIE